MSPTIVALTLLLTSAFGFYALWGFSSSNGLFEYIPETAKTLFSDSANPTTLTGINALDEQLKVLVSFFWPVIDGRSPDLSLHAVNFMFQGATMWLLLMVEGLRRGNDWKVVSLYVSNDTNYYPLKILISFIYKHHDFRPSYAKYRLCSDSTCIPRPAPADISHSGPT
jgi:hypothetical protein